MKKFAFAFFIIASSLSFGFNDAQAQRLSSSEKQNFEIMEDSLISVAEKMLRDELQNIRVQKSFEFTSLLKFTLELPNSYAYPFENLAKTIHVVTSEDKKFKIFNWLVATNDINRRYYGIIQTEDALFPLFDNPGDINEALMEKTLDTRTWYGNEIYRLQPFTYNKQTVYLWYGLNTDGAQISKKSLDVLYFSDGKPYFGLPIFQFPGKEHGQLKFYHRIIWEYSKYSGFTLNYDEDKKMVLFDKLQSVVFEDKRKNTYAPSGQTQGLRWKNGRFEFLEEAIPILQLEDGGAPVDGVFKN